MSGHVPDRLARARARDLMVEHHLIARGIRDPAVLAAMRAVPREAFVEPALADEAYDDRPLPIGDGQTVSQPYMVALMAEAAGFGPDARVLEVGAGCGYAAAVLGRLARQVFAIERLASLGEAARRQLFELGYGNVAVRVGDGTRGWPEAAPFDAVVVSAAGARVPEALTRQLAVGGRLVAPVGPPGAQSLRRVTRRGAEAFGQEDLGPVAFVPLVADSG